MRDGTRAIVVTRYLDYKKDVKQGVLDAQRTELAWEWFQKTRLHSIGGEEQLLPGIKNI